jgi:hypothetical protein
MNLRNAFGFLLIAVGLIAIPIPIVPGFPLIAAGVALLGRRHPMILFCRAWLQKRGWLKRRTSAAPKTAPAQLSH